LTFNYWRKGGYNIGSEDYRWEILRKQIPPPFFFLFNVTFISLAQCLLLFTVTSPTYILLLASRISADPPSATAPLLAWSNEDFIICYFMVGLILVAAAADQQQWWFQEAKKSYQATAKVPAGHKQSDLDRGFIVTGLWSYSRHPNFAAEQTFWVAMYQWSCLVSGSLYNWSGLGALGYLALFQGSTRFTEQISGGKYPEYKEYQARVGKFLPRFNVEPPNWDAPRKERVKGGANGGVEGPQTKARQRYDLR
jgi:steroid 5-alpha reductase family enzyme